MQIRALERKVSTLPRLVGARIPLLRAAGVGGYITGEHVFATFHLRQKLQTAAKSTCYDLSEVHQW